MLVIFSAAIVCNKLKLKASLSFFFEPTHNGVHIWVVVFFFWLL